MTTSSTPCFRRRVAVEWRRSWKRMRRSPARSRSWPKRRVMLAGSRRPADEGRARHGRSSGPLSARPPRAGQRPGRIEAHSGRPEASKRGARPHGERQAEARRRQGVGLSAARSGVGRLRVLYPPPRAGAHVGQGQGAARANSGQDHDLPECRASGRPPDHARPQPGQDTCQSPLHRPRARDLLMATPTATGAHNTALPRTPTDR